MKIRTYTELARLTDFNDRFEYLQMPGQVGEKTFGFDRYLNQKFYTSYEWRTIRRVVIARDMGCDLGIRDFPINFNILVHHMNPMTREDILSGSDLILDPEFLITTTKNTHNAIHFGDKRFLPRVLIARQPGDTRLW